LLILLLYFKFFSYYIIKILKLQYKIFHYSSTVAFRDYSMDIKSVFFMEMENFLITLLFLIFTLEKIRLMEMEKFLNYALFFKLFHYRKSFT